MFTLRWELNLHNRRMTKHSLGTRSSSNVIVIHIFSYTMARTIYISIRWRWCPICTRPTRLFKLLVLAHWNKSPRVDMSIYSDSLTWYRVIQSLLLLLNTACLVEKQLPMISVILVVGEYIVQEWKGNLCTFFSLYSPV
jgi:hypothetical protein